MGFEDSDGVTHRFNYCRPATTRNFCCTSDRGFSSISALPARTPLDPAERASPRSYYLSNFFFLFFFSAASADFSAFFTRATKRRKNPIPFCGGRISGRSRYRFAAQQTLLLLLLSTSLDEKIFDFSSLFFSFPIPPDSISEWRKNPQDPERSILSPRNRENRSSVATNYLQGKLLAVVEETKYPSERNLYTISSWLFIF